MSLIQSFLLEHFRGFYEKEKINFAIPNGNLGSGLTVIVGPNNGGKSSLLDAIYYFCRQIAVPENERHFNKDCIFELEFKNGDSGKWISRGNGTQPKVSPGNSMRLENLMIRSEWISQAQQANEMTYAQYVQDVNNNFPTRIITDQNLVRVLYWINRNPELKTQMNSIIKRFFKDFKDWYVEGNRIEYQINDERHHLFDQFGNGMRSLFRVATCFACTDNNDILVVDEPEFFMHPWAIKILSEIFYDRSRSKQMIVVTHSPHFINWAAIKNGCKVVRVVKENDACKIYNLRSDLALYEVVLSLEENWQKPQLMDVTAKEIFFAERVLFVEGQEDVGLLRKYLKENDKKIDFEIFGYGVGGADNIKYFLKLANDLGIKSAAIYDLNKQDLANESKNTFTGSLILTLPVGDIRDKFEKDKNGKDTNQKITNGLFDKSGTLKGEFGNVLPQIFEQLENFFNG